MADTRHGFIIGHPVAHSRSPLVHGYWLKRYGIDGDYVRIDVAPDDVTAFMARLRSGEAGLVGGNVTMPHKAAAFQAADRPDEMATALGAANTLWVEDGLIHATNTDGHGFAANLDDCHPGWDRTAKAVVLGAGGGARSILLALKKRGIADIRLVNRTIGRAEELAARFGPGIVPTTMEDLGQAMEGAGLFVNTTSLGMKGSPVPAFDFSPLLPAAVVADIVYVPLMTPILKQAADQGFSTADGLGMLLHQAVPGFEKWFGKTPVVDAALRAEIIADLERHA
ncbi:shikimate dehydrogenase [Martelella alba]|uniref:Shikimate dehydrogenase (NADP(+)) n=1 Tax=Martelella alba TaxID=2590451 RepID=A0A506U3P0_9HYPH|nr:shikimate dehydrogenase [Martelella alba]TPW28450.1 shikimate dehydrogenase [Martelella alba]